MAPPIGPHGNVVVGTAVDSGYAVPFAAMLRSAVRPGVAITVHVIDMGVRPADKERLESIGPELVWHDRGPVERFPLTRQMTMATYARLHVADALPEDVTRIIWLDTDLLVTGELERLWAEELDGRHLLAVQDPCVPFLSSRYGVGPWRELGLPAAARYFNAGVMLIDLERWRRDAVGEKAREYLRRTAADITFWDQEGLNAVLFDRWGELDVRWNHCPSFTGRTHAESSRLDPWILHFAGRMKPWRFPPTETGPRALFYRALDDTPWAGWRPRRTARSAIAGWYERSAVRNTVYPAEHLWTLRVSPHLQRAWARHAGA